MNEKQTTGAFKDLPENQRPCKIPVEKYASLASTVAQSLSSLGQVFIPDIQKSLAVGKTHCKDIDVLFNPYNRQTWRQDVAKLFNRYIIASISNGPQLMTVMQGLIDNNPYMIDIILSKEGSFEYRKKYAEFGTIIPAALGSFARSLHYKYDQNGLYGRYRDSKGNYHNILLTNDYNTAMAILMLDTTPVEQQKLFSPEQVAEWIASSPRFDSSVWKAKPIATDGITIVVKNRKSHRAAKTKPEVKATYLLLDKTNKTSTWNNENYKIERMVLGDEFVENVIRQIGEMAKKADVVISGKEVMDILKIAPGPKVGAILKYIKDSDLTREQALEYLRLVSDK
jgi:hypothetical protein